MWKQIIIFRIELYYPVLWRHNYLIYVNVDKRYISEIQIDFCLKPCVRVCVFCDCDFERVCFVSLREILPQLGEGAEQSAEMPSHSGSAACVCCTSHTLDGHHTHTHVSTQPPHQVAHQIVHTLGNITSNTKPIDPSRGLRRSVACRRRLFVVRRVFAESSLWSVCSHIFATHGQTHVVGGAHLTSPHLLRTPCTYKSEYVPFKHTECVSAILRRTII